MNENPEHLWSLCWVHLAVCGSCALHGWCGGQEEILCLPHTVAGPYMLYFLQGSCFASKPVCRSACRVDLMSPECIREVIAAQGHHRCLRGVWCSCAAFVLPPHCLGALRTPEAHLYCLKLNIKLWGFCSPSKQDMLSASFFSGDLAGSGTTHRGPDLVVGLIIRAWHKFCLSMIHWKIKLESTPEIWKFLLWGKTLTAPCGSCFPSSEGQLSTLMWLKGCNFLCKTNFEPAAPL